MVLGIVFSAVAAVAVVWIIYAVHKNREAA